MKKKFALIIMLIILPSMLFVQKAWADVIFSEIAWMGGPNSSADEWIEIYNNGTETINLDGYVIESESKKLSIKLSGNILAKAYYLIERTDDNSVPSIVADLVSTFGTGLSNSGDNLYLKNTEGQAVNSLMFASGWPAGDNTTKQTMQYVGTNWITAESTPKKQPANNNSDGPGDNKNTVDSTPKTTVTSGGGTYIPPKNQSRFLVSVTGDQLAQVPIEIEIDHRDDMGNKNNYGLYKVNFGDGVEQVFKLDEKITHTYQYLGYYRVTVRFTESIWSIIPKKQTYIDIEIKEPLIYIDTSRAPILIIKNKSNKDLDLNNFVLIVGSKSFNPPVGSILFSNKDLWLGPAVTGFVLDDFVNVNLSSKAGISIAYESNVLSLKKSVNLAINSNINTSNSVKNLNTQKTSSVLGASSESVNIDDLRFLPEGNTANISDALPIKKQKTNNLIVWFMFGALVLGGSFVFIKLRKIETKEADEFTFIEE